MRNGDTAHGLLVVLLVAAAVNRVTAVDLEKRDIAKDALKIGCFCLGIASLMIIPFCAFKHHRGQKRHRSKSAASGDILETIVIGPPPPIPEDFPSPPPVRIYHKPIPFIPSEIEEKHEPLSLSLPDDE